MKNSMKGLIVLIITCLAIGEGFSQQNAIASLAKMEKEFSEYTISHGGPEAWTKYFASDGIMFTPQPVNAIEFMKPRLAVKRPRINKLQWEASFSDISSAGDFGYNIGPSVVENIKFDTVPKQYGYIFSVWKKVDDSTWRVAIDAGIAVKVKSDDHQLTGKHTRCTASKPGKLSYSFLEAESRFFKLALENDFLTAYKRNLIEQSKMLKNEWALYNGKREILEWFEGNDKGSMLEKAELKLMGSGSSKSDDLAFTYGSYVKITSREEGLFVHVWKRINSEWYLVVDVTGPVPKN